MSAHASSAARNARPRHKVATTRLLVLLITTLLPLQLTALLITRVQTPDHVHRPASAPTPDTPVAEDPGDAPAPRSNPTEALEINVEPAPTEPALQVQQAPRRHAHPHAHPHEHEHGTPHLHHAPQALVTPDQLPSPASRSGVDAAEDALHAEQHARGEAHRHDLLAPGVIIVDLKDGARSALAASALSSDQPWVPPSLRPMVALAHPSFMPVRQQGALRTRVIEPLLRPPTG